MLDGDENRAGTSLDDLTCPHGEECPNYLSILEYRRSSVGVRGFLALIAPEKCLSGRKQCRLRDDFERVLYGEALNELDLPDQHQLSNCQAVLRLAESVGDAINMDDRCDNCGNSKFGCPARPEISALLQSSSLDLALALSA